MNPEGRQSDALRFGIFELDPKRGELRKSGTLIKLQSQQLQLLALLAERPGEVVSRVEIRQALWDSETFVDFDQSINFCVTKVREALGDNPQRPRYIETVPRKGYRFIAPMAGWGPAIEATNSSKGKPVPAMRRWLLPGSAAALVAIALAIVTSALRPRPLKPVESLAVLPLENLSHDPEEEYFADGITDDLITELAKIGALRVVSRTSVIQYKGTKKTASQIARELNVDAVLEGTVERDRDQIRITAQLIAAAPERHLWAERYEARLSDVLNVQASVASAVAEAIQVKVTQPERSQVGTRRAVDPEAYEAYLKGRYLWQPGGEGNLTKSLEYFQQAIHKDPHYALAWAGLADTFNRLASWGVLPRREAAPQARTAATKALELDHTLVGPMIALAAVKMEYEWDWPGAEHLLKHALELAPNNGIAHTEYAGLLAATGKKQEGVAEMRLACRADPLDSVIAANLGWKLYLAHNYEEAEREFGKWHEWHPSEYGDYILASVYMQTGRSKEAVDELQAAASRTHHQALLELMYLGHALGVTGARDAGRKVLGEMQALSQSRYVPPDYIAMVYEGLGDRDQAIKWYEKATDERSMNTWILSDQRLDLIRSDPRFKTLMRRMGLPE